MLVCIIKGAVLLKIGGPPGWVQVPNTTIELKKELFRGFYEIKEQPGWVQWAVGSPEHGVFWVVCSAQDRRTAQGATVFYACSIAPCSMADRGLPAVVKPRFRLVRGIPRIGPALKTFENAASLVRRWVAGPRDQCFCKQWTMR